MVGAETQEAEDAGSVEVLQNLLLLGDHDAGFQAWKSISRADALDFGRRHFEAMVACRSIAAKFGGGIVGVARAIISELVARGIITDGDHARLMAMFDAFAHEDVKVGLSRAIELHEASTADPEASSFALACSAVAAASARSALQTENMTNASGAEVVAADVVGTALGGLAGPLGALSGGLSASLAVGGV